MTKLIDYDPTLLLDSHADTCFLGCDALIIQDYNRPLEVTGFDPTLGSQYYLTVSGVVNYTHPTTGERFHLTSLLCELDSDTMAPSQRVIGKSYTWLERK